MRSNTTYGLNVYDYIILDASTIDEEAISSASYEGSTQEVIYDNPDESLDDVDNQDASREDIVEEPAEDNLETIEVEGEETSATSDASEAASE